LGLPIIQPGDDLAALTVEALSSAGLGVRDGDVFVFTHVVVSRSEGCLVDLGSVRPGARALEYAEITGKDPRLVEVVLREARAVRKIAPGVLITETRHGFVCANSGVDKSNVPGEEVVAPLPEDPDASARRIREGIEGLTGARVAVIVSDTFGRAHREGEVNMAIGSSGMGVLRDRRGERDLFGYVLRVKRTAVVDELAAAAELVIGQSGEGVPVALIRGYGFEGGGDGCVSELVRPRERDLFL